MAIQITIPIIPKAQMRARSTVRGKHAMTYKAPQQKKYEDILSVELALHAPEVPIDGPVGLYIMAKLPIPLSWSKKKKALAEEGKIRPTGKPDLDNYIKNIMDCMTQCSYWTDDSRVIAIKAAKVYSDTPGWDIIVKEFIL